MTDEPFDLDRHRGRAAQKAIDLRRSLADAESSARVLRERQAALENELMSIAATVAKASYVLNLYAAGLSPADTHHRDLVAAILADFARLSHNS
jgi:hypothetical protein